MRGLFIKILIIILLGGTKNGICEPGNIGTPLVRQYNRSDFKAGRQTWMISQSHDGMMYFANNDGLLEFDGSNWRLYQLPNQTIVRSLKINQNGRIYVGGFNEFGFFELDTNNEMQYHSLVDLIPEDKRDFGDIWKIHITPSGIIFQSFVGIYIVNNGAVEVIEPSARFHFSFYVRGEFYVIDLKEGIMRMSFGKLFPVMGTEKLIGQEIRGMLPVGEKLLIATANSGCFLYNGSQLEEWNESLCEILRQNQIFSVSKIGDSSIAFGTIQKGLIISDFSGNIKLWINRNNGLQNNTVLSMQVDDFNNLWLGLDNGIDYVEVNSPLRYLAYQHGLSSGYAAVIHEEILYLGTNQGVYSIDWNRIKVDNSTEMAFELVENTSGQVWSLQRIKGNLVCGHNNGTYLIKGKTAYNISEIDGGWAYIELAGHKDHLLGGTYSGLILLESGENGIRFKRRIEGFHESSRDILQDRNGDIWIGHGLKGVFRVKLSPSLDSAVQTRFYNSSDGLPSDFGTTLFAFGNKVYFATENGIYGFDSETDEFHPDTKLNELLGRKNFNKLQVDNDGNIWYFTPLAAGVYRLQEDGTYLDITLPFKQLYGSFIGGFPFVYPYNDQHVFFGVENGFVHYDPSYSKDYQKSLKAYIRKLVTGKSDSLIFSGKIEKVNINPPEIDFRNNSVHFYYGANDFENPDGIEYSTFLNGYETSWSGWDSDNKREFTNLHEGAYIFSVKARNIYGVQSPPVSFSFVIDPPLHRSLAAYIFYFLIGLILLFVVFLFIKRKIKRSKLEAERKKENQFREIEENLRRDTLHAEKEIIRLRNEKLREQMRLRDKELANSTFQTIQKNKLLLDMKKELRHFMNQIEDDVTKSNINFIIKKINREINDEKQWEIFETHFENVHEEFLKRIKSEFPDLTPRELKLCAYLRMNISSKEISLLMNISTRGVEISRYRLRKKLNLDRSENLTEFILSY
ncbi:MAG: triple tyrosine motif-containing protein [Bacteroidota bacterium]|nr:triple tyrosine motif-containing protein [Bacteroidota bacterium]